jgi:hypothetical protein
MAVMIPSVIPATAPPGEREIFARLRDDPATAGWFVLHSLDIANHLTQVSGEADFVVIIPSHGVLVVEVKSHERITRGEDGLWYFGASTQGEARGPFKQASDAMHSLRQRLVDGSPDLSGVTFSSCVVFPRASGRVVTGEWHPWQFIDSGKFKSAPLPGLLMGVLQNAVSFLASRGVGGSVARPLGPEDTRRIAALLRPVFEGYQSPAARAKHLQEEVKHFTNEQAEVLDTIGENPRLILHGPAGTGKTMLALEAARRAAVSGLRAGLFCYNRFLGQKLKESTDKVPGLKASSIHRYMCDLAGVLPPHQASPSWWEVDLPAMVSERFIEKKIPPPFDEIILDEFQDLLTPMVLDVIDLLVVGGLAKGRWRAFGDFHRQSIYKTEQGITLEGFIKSHAPSATKARLTVNCRNLPRVAKHIEKLGQLTPAYTRVRRGDDGVDPSFRFHQSEEDQELNLRRLIMDFEADGISKHDIVVLSPYKDCAASRLAARDGKSATLTAYDGESLDKIRYCTIHSFKGLEASAIILTDIGDVQSQDASDLFYIGMSRSVQKLGICASSAVALQLLKISNT